MRQGLRASAPARADRATAFRSLPQIWGGQFKGWLSPALAMGPGDKQNKWGAIHSQTGENNDTGTNAFARMAFSDLGDVFTGRRVVINGTVSGTTLTVNSVTSGVSGDIAAGMALLYDAWQANGTAGTGIIISGTYPTFTLRNSPGNATVVSITLVDKYLGIDGQPAFSRIADPDDASGQRYCWQHRLTFEDYRPSGQGETSPGLRKMLARFGDTGAAPMSGQGIVQDIGTYYMDLFAIRIPAATRDLIRYADSVLLWQHKNSTGQPGIGIYQFSGQAQPSGLGPAAGLAPATEPRLILRLYAGGSVNGAYVIAANYPADTWVYVLLRVKPHPTDGSAHTQCFISVGDAAAAKVVDATRGNSDDAAADTNRQWGWYMFNNSSNCWNNGVNAFPASGAWWGPGNELKLQVKDYLVAEQWAADMEPPLWLVDRWFDQLRAR